MIINLTQHAASAEQVAAGVVDLSPADAAVVRELLTFDDLPFPWQVIDRANAIAKMVLLGYGPGVSAMIGGAPYLMAPLERCLRARGIAPVYAFSRRESVEQAQPDGSVRKVAVFRHAGFVPAVPG
jgi:hypothetical protein